MGKFMVGFSTGVPKSAARGRRITAMAGKSTAAAAPIAAITATGFRRTPISGGGEPRCRTAAPAQRGSQLPDHRDLGVDTHRRRRDDPRDQERRQKLQRHGFASGANKAMQSSNLDDELRARGARPRAAAPKRMTSIGPRRADLTRRDLVLRQCAASGPTRSSGQPVRPDGKQMESYVKRTDYFGKVTWQVNKNNKITFADSREGITVRIAAKARRSSIRKPRTSTRRTR